MAVAQFVVAVVSGYRSGGMIVTWSPGHFGINFALSVNGSSTTPPPPPTGGTPVANQQAPLLRLAA
jgi:hypothetical protein